MPSSAVRDIEYDQEAKRSGSPSSPRPSATPTASSPSPCTRNSSTPSKGTYFNRFIRDQYDYSEVPEE